jgi:hypothetical protein
MVNLLNKSRGFFSNTEQMILFREEIVMVKGLNYYDNHVYVHELHLLTLFEESEMIQSVCVYERLNMEHAV